jgi:hypothetical protein
MCLCEIAKNQDFLSQLAASHYTKLKHLLLNSSTSQLKSIVELIFNATNAPIYGEERKVLSKQKVLINKIRRKKLLGLKWTRTTLVTHRNSCKSIVGIVLASLIEQEALNIQCETQ